MPGWSTLTCIINLRRDDASIAVAAIRKFALLRWKFHSRLGEVRREWRAIGDRAADGKSAPNFENRLLDFLGR